MTDGVPTSEVTDLVHQRNRLALLSALHENGKSDFSFLKSLLGMTDGNLGRHIEILADNGLVSVTKKQEGARLRTWVTITRAGRSALAAEVAALRALVERFDAVEQAPKTVRRPASRTPAPLA